MIKHLSGDFNKEIEKGKILVDFYADWCGPCRMMQPILENVQGINILKVNVDQFPMIAQKYGVISIPTLLIFENGKISKSHIGMMNLDELSSFIK